MIIWYRLYGTLHYSIIISYSVVFSTFDPKDLKERISDSELCTCFFSPDLVYT